MDKTIKDFAEDLYAIADSGTGMWSALDNLRDSDWHRRAILKWAAGIPLAERAAVWALVEEESTPAPGDGDGWTSDDRELVREALTTGEVL